MSDNYNENNQNNENNEFNENNEYKPDFVISEDNKQDSTNPYIAPSKPPKKKRKFAKSMGLLGLALVFTITGGAIGAGIVLSNTKGSINEINKRYGQYLNYNPPTFKTDKEALSVTEVVKKVGPAVVGVSTTTKVNYGIFSEGIPGGMGSGFIISEEGYVLTNYHVIQGAQSVKVILSDGTEVNAKVVNYDAQQDLAVVKITDNVKVPGVVELGDSDSLQAGEQVVAIGNPLGKEFLGSVTTGIISAVNREIAIEGKTIKYLQTDAAINPGNSGGPLLNSKGQVIGINTAKIKTEGVEGIGFSIPINNVKSRLTALSKPILRIGIAGRDITQDIAKKNKLPEGEYILIVDVQEFSPAEKAGLKPGDMITKFDGKKVKTVDEINKIKETHKAGDVVKVEITRDAKDITLELTLSE